jgi:hypothetical protein
MQRRHIHEARQLPAVSQELIWLDGEALCVTPGYQRDHAGVLPVLQLPECKDVVRATVPLPRGRQGFFIRRRMDCFVSWLTSRIRGKPVATPEVRQAGLLYRLQRYGVSTAKLLAFGQRQVSPWRTESFLLTEPPARSRGLAHWLAEGSTSRRQRWKLLGEIGRMMQRLHAAGCCLLDHVPGAKTAPLLSVVETDADNQHVMLTRIDGVRHCRKVRESETVRDLTTMHRQHQSAGLSRTDELRVILAYLGQKRLTADGKRFVRQVESQNRQEAHA